MTKPRFYLCGCCAEFHHENRDPGIDCRDNLTRFSIGELDAEHGPDGWGEVPDPIGEE